MPKPYSPADLYTPAKPSPEKPAGRWGRYRSDHCRSLSDLLPPHENYDYLQASKGNTARQFQCRNKHQLAKKIALDFLELLVDHLIDTGDQYRFPSGNARLRVVAMPVNSGLRLLRKGSYRMNDARATGGRFYQLQINLGEHGRTKAVYIDMGRYHRICYLVATGQVTYDLS